MSPKKNTGLSSFVYKLLPPKSAKSREISQKFELRHTALQGHRPWCQSKVHYTTKYNYYRFRDIDA